MEPQTEYIMGDLFWYNPKTNCLVHTSLVKSPSHLYDLIKIKKKSFDMISPRTKKEAKFEFKNSVPNFNYAFFFTPETAQIVEYFLKNEPNNGRFDLVVYQLVSSEAKTVEAYFVVERTEL